VLLMADCFDVALDEVKLGYELRACAKDVGIPRVETHLEWQLTPHTDPSWNINGRYITQITSADLPLRGSAGRFKR
jgi:4-hydroxy-tetrahydrodipicolinate reductase